MLLGSPSPCDALVTVSVDDEFLLVRAVLIAPLFVTLNPVVCAFSPGPCTQVCWGGQSRMQGGNLAVSA